MQYIILPYRRTRTGQVVGGCFPEEEQWPEHTNKHTHTDKYFHILSLIYFGWKPALYRPVRCRSLKKTGELHKHHHLSASSSSVVPRHYHTSIDHNNRKHTHAHSCNMNKHGRIYIFLSIFFFCLKH